MTDADRLIAPGRQAEDVDAALRPKRLDEFVGQAAARENLRVFIQAAKARGEALDHVLFFGPPGLGKTTLAQIVAREMGVGFRATSGPVIAKSGDLAALLTNLEDGDVLFIDEIHRLQPAVEEVRYPAMEARALDRQGRTHVLSRAGMDFAYRHCGAPEELIFVEALFRGRPGDPAAILAAMTAITQARGASQPVNTRTGGSTFKNPPGAKAWRLVDEAGCRGLRIGDAQVSELHCNFLVNHGRASAAEIEALGEEVRRRVRERSGVELEWEIRRVGLPARIEASTVSA